MNLDENVLRAPKTGYYYFQATSVATSNNAAPLVLLRNTNTVVMETGSHVGTNHVVVYLTSGDKMQLMVQAREQSMNGDQQGSPPDVTLTAFFVA